jgi:hypothetical protein
VIYAGTVVFGRNAGDLPFEAEFGEKPLSAVDEKTRESPTDMSKTNKRKVNLSGFLFHQSSICFYADPRLNITTLAVCAATKPVPKKTVQGSAFKVKKCFSQ